MRERQADPAPPARARAGAGPGSSGSSGPGQLWHLDMTSIWVAEHGWVYLNAIIDCCTREIVGWELSLRCRAIEAIAVVERPPRSISGPIPSFATLLQPNLTRRELTERHEEAW